MRKSNSKCVTTFNSLRCLHGTVFRTPRRKQIQFLATTLAHHTKTLYACLTLHFQHRSATKTAPIGTSQSGGCAEKKDAHTTLLVNWRSLRLRDFIIF